MKSAISISPIGKVISPVQEAVDENWGAVVSTVQLLPEYSGGLDGLQDFSHVIVVTFLHKAKFEAERHLKRRPRGLASMPMVGIFSQRAKDRPNQIGVTTVKLIRVGGDFIEVLGLDAVNDTPVLDIKPYYPAYDRAEQAKTPGWVDELIKAYF